MIIKKQQNQDGSRPPIQSWSHSTPPKGYAFITDTDLFYQYNGFVHITVEDDTVTEITPNVEAWEEWKANQPPPTPIPDPPETTTYTDLANAIREGVNDVD